MERGLLTARGLDRVLRVAWTVADLAGHDRPGRRRRRARPCNCAPASAAACPTAIWSAAVTPGTGEGERRRAPPHPGRRARGRSTAARWLREVGARARPGRRLAGGGEPLPGAVSAARCGGVRGAGPPAPDPERTWRPPRRPGARFVCPGDDGVAGAARRPRDASGPSACGCADGPSLRLWALRSVAVVGARACTDYGAHMAARSARASPSAGWVVVSGAAYGVDGAAHRGALRRGRRHRRRAGLRRRRALPARATPS